MDLQDILNSGSSFRYQLLSRMKMDCDYYLGNGQGSNKHLWAGNVDDQIKAMKALWNSFPEDKKPEWLSMEEIESYEAKMSNAPLCNVRGLIIPVLEKPHEIFISRSDELNELQQYVGGFVEPLDVLGNGISLYINEEGIGVLPPNRALYATKEMEEAGYLSQMDFSHVVKEGELYTILFGNIVAVSYDENMELQDLTQEQIDGLCEQFKETDSGFREALKIVRQRNEPFASSREAVSLAGERKDMQAAKDALSSNTSVSEKDREVR